MSDPYTDGYNDGYHDAVEDEDNTAWWEFALEWVAGLAGYMTIGAALTFGAICMVRWML